MRTLLIPLLLGLAVLPASAEVYRWTDDKGVVHYGDRPPSPTAAPVELPPLQTYRPSGPIKVPASGPEPADNGAPQRVSIVSPRPEDTIRDPEGKVSIAVDAKLAPGQGLFYVLDGRRQNQTATPSTAWLLEGVERGEHQVEVVQVSRDGAELARSAPVTIYLMPPGLMQRAR